MIPAGLALRDGLACRGTRSRCSTRTVREEGRTPLENGTRRICLNESLRKPEKFAGDLRYGKENRALGSFRENIRKNAERGMAERVGVFDAISRNPNEYGRLQRNARDRNDLASSNFCRRLRLFARVCRFFYHDDTRNGTRRGGLREGLVRHCRGVSSQHPTPWPR